MDEDPRKKIPQYNACSVSYDENSNVKKIVFNSKADLLDARYELVELNKTIMVYNDDDEEYVLIEPNRVVAASNAVTLSAADNDDEEE